MKLTIKNVKRLKIALEEIKTVLPDRSFLEKYAQKGVNALEEYTPKDTGLTAASWQYKIVEANGKARIEFYNTNIQNGLNVAMLIRYGHGTQNGGYVQGVDYITPALKPVFKEMSDEIQRGLNRNVR